MGSWVFVILSLYTYSPERDKHISIISSLGSVNLSVLGSGLKIGERRWMHAEIKLSHTLSTTSISF